MKVLSLFDGCSCGQVALQRAGIKVDRYSACEIEPNAIKITQKNFPNTVQLGDVTKWVRMGYASCPKPDLMLAGSPCTNLSRAGNGLGLKGEQSKLFWDFHYLWRTLVPKYFLLENTLMSKDNEWVISDAMGVKAVRINSSRFGSQNRDRLYWTNIPIAPLPNNDDVLKDVLLDNNDPRLNDFFLTKEGLNYVDRLKNGKPRWKSYPNPLNGKAGCLTAVMAKGVPYGVIRELGRFIHPVEAERLQGLPDQYTEGVAKTHRYKMLGNGWTVDVIAHILKGIM